MEPLLHYVVPLVALLLLGEEPGKAARVALLGLLPDVDAFFLTHRSPTHSLVVIGLAYAPAVYLVGRYRPVHLRTAVLSFLVTASHPVLDLGSLTPILWPLLPCSVSLDLALRGEISRGVALAPSASFNRAPTEFTRVTGINYPLFTGEGLLITLVLLLPVLYGHLKNRR